MKKLIALALAVMALAGCSSSPGSSLRNSVLVEFKVYSISEVRTVENVSIISLGGGVSNTINNIQLPYSEEILAPAKVVLFTPDSLQLTVNTTEDGGRFVCEIYVNNKLVDQQEVEGEHQSVTCSGLAASS